MKHIKQFLLVFFLWGCTLSLLQAQNMYVLETNATQTAYAIGDIRSLTFTPGHVLVNETAGNTNTYALSDVRYINFDITTLAEKHELQACNFSLFPNPVNDYLNIKYQGHFNETLQLVIYDIQGREVYKETINDKTAVLQVNISNLDNGMYLCRIYNNNNSISKKFIKN